MRWYLDGNRSPLFRNALVRFYKVPKHVGLCRSNDASIYVGPRAEVVKDTSRDGGIDKIEAASRFASRSVEFSDIEWSDKPSCSASTEPRRPPWLRDFRNHGYVWKFIGRPVRVYREEVGPMASTPQGLEQHRHVLVP